MIFGATAENKFNPSIVRLIFKVQFKLTQYINHDTFTEYISMFVADITAVFE